MEQYAESHGCTYIDFFNLFDEAGFDSTTDFYDEGHLNLNGSMKLANYLGKFISENYNLKDMRTIPNNPWEQALALQNGS